MRHLIWGHKPTQRRPRPDPCRTHRGLPKFVHRTKGSAQREAMRLGRRATAYWCERHGGWHVGNLPRVTAWHERNVDLGVELGDRVLAALLEGDRFADPVAMRRVLDRKTRATAAGGP